jgi:hypothetical protein
MDDGIRAIIERPEAQDLLRKSATTLADHIPGAKLLIQMTNRMALAEDPWLKGAFGWQHLKLGDDAARSVTMSPFRGAKVPFVENEVGQIWVPRQAGQRANLFSRGEGEWIGVGDVFESVMRGERTYLGRLTEQQVDFVLQAQKSLAPYVSFAEQATGQHITKRLVYWPRFAQDPTRGRWNVTTGRRGKPPAFFQRVFESQEEAISQHGIKYKPGVLKQMDTLIEGMQRMTRDAILGKYLKREGVLRLGKPTLTETYAADIGPAVEGVIAKEHLREIMTAIGPGTTNPVISVPQKMNAIARMLLTGSLDTGWGLIQLTTLVASPAGPEKWAEALARGFWNMIVEPKQVYRFMANSPAARRYSMYGGNLGVESEFFEAARTVGLPRAPVISPVVDVATFPIRSFISRLQAGFDSSLLYGRIFAFDAMADVAAKPGVLRQALGAPERLGGAALHDELFRVARFADTLIGQPKLAGVLSSRQLQIESAFVWFATRYTRSFLGTMSYVVGTGYTPAEARVIMAKLLMGGAAMTSGLIAAHGAATGRRQEQILQDITTALNPQSGKKFMSMKIGDTWYGLGGVWRSGFGAFGGMADKDNWDFDTWEERLWDNPFIQQLRSRTAPITSTLMDFLEGEDYLGYEVDFGEFVDDPRKLGDYAIDKFAPITIDAFLQGHGDWQNRLPATIAEFFGLRTSPETAWEALSPVMDRVSQERFGVPFESLEHNLPAKDWVQNHPSVLAVAEGRVRPIRDRNNEKKWNAYTEKRDSIRFKYALQKVELEGVIRAGRMDGRQYREQYGDIRSREFAELLGMREGLGVEFGEREAPEGTVNAALDSYFAIDLEDYIDKETRTPDWELFFSDRDAALSGLPDEQIPVVQEWLTRRETELRRDFRREFEVVIEASGYFRMRELMATELGIGLDDIESMIVADLQKKGRRAAPADVGRLTDQFINMLIKQTYGDAAPSLSSLKSLLREQNPRLDVELFRQGFATTVRSEAAIALSQQLGELYPDRAYFLPPLSSDVKGRED